MMHRAQNWENLFDPATGYVRPAKPMAASRPGRPSRPAPRAGGQEGFEEGNAIQYTWAVPQDLAGIGS